METQSPKDGAEAQRPAARLGKGLASLFPGAAKPLVEDPAAPVVMAPTFVETPVTPAAKMESAERIPGISMVAVDDLKVNPYQPRRVFENDGIEELTASIKHNGIIQPLVVRRTQEGYQLIAGERRLRAAKAAGLKHVPIVIRRTTDLEALELALVENIQRRDLNCVDQALAYQQLQEDFSLTQEEIARRVAKDRASVANHMRLLRLPAEVLEMLKVQVISFGHAKALLMVEDRDAQIEAAKKMQAESLSVRAAEELMTLVREQVEAQKAANGLPAETKLKAKTPMGERLNALSRELSQAWATRIELKGGEKKGKVTIAWGSRADLDRIITALQNANVWQEKPT